MFMTDWSALMTPQNATLDSKHTLDQYPFDVSHLSFNFFCLLLLQICISMHLIYGEFQLRVVLFERAGEEQVPPAVHPAGGREAGVLLQLHTLAGQDTSTRSSTYYHNILRFLRIIQVFFISFQTLLVFKVFYGFPSIPVQYLCSYFEGPRKPEEKSPFFFSILRVNHGSGTVPQLNTRLQFCPFLLQFPSIANLFLSNFNLLVRYCTHLVIAVLNRAQFYQVIN